MVTKGKRKAIFTSLLRGLLVHFLGTESALDNVMIWTVRDYTHGAPGNLTPSREQNANKDPPTRFPTSNTGTLLHFASCQG